MKYMPRLDGLRFIAIMMVMIQHFIYFIGIRLNGGFYGVNLFFVLSGFLITSILLADKSVTFKEGYKKFIGRRVLRIFPIYYLMILILVLISADHVMEDLIYLLTYTFNYRVGYTQNWESLYFAYWSLSVEEQFYIFFPIIVLLLKRNKRLLSGIFIFLLLFGYAQFYFNILGLKQYNYVGLPTNMSFLIMGALGALAYRTDKLPEKFFTNLYVEIVAITWLCYGLTLNNWHTRILLLPLLNLYLVIKAACFSFRITLIDKMLLHRWINYMGRVSYGMYLYHIIVGYYFNKYFFDPLWEKIPFKSLGFLSKVEYNAWAVRFPLVVLAVLGVSSLSYHYIETPFTKLKDKLFYNK